MDHTWLYENGYANGHELLVPFGHAARYSGPESSGIDDDKQARLWVPTARHGNSGRRHARAASPRRPDTLISSCAPVAESDRWPIAGRSRSEFTANRHELSANTTVAS
ncbi:hypothetical protein FRC12_006547 [Ceratobasidium sp. 428]|nr:hypothetical protein FRC12_006547 [Ceratobasidium sp. 428]